MALRPIESISGLFDTDEGKLVGIFPTGTNDVSYLPTSENRVSGVPVGAVVDPATGGISLQGVPVGVSAAFSRGAPIDVMASGAPTVTVSTSGNPSISGAVEHRWDGGDIYFSGAMSASNATYGQAAYVSQENGTLSSGGALQISFCTDAPVFEIGTFDCTGMRIFVDGKAVSASETTGAGNLVIKVDFSSVRKSRRIDLIVQPLFFRGVWVPPTSAVWKPAIKTRAIVLGDSFTAGQAGVKASSQIAPQLKYRLGIDTVWASGSGGTGYVNPFPSQSKKKLRDRLYSDLYPYQFEMIVVAMGCNDWYANDYATLYPEALDTLAQIKAKYPNALIVVFTGWRPANGASPDEYITQAVRDAASANKVPCFDTRTWLGGSGHVGATTGAGVSDWAVGVDGTHPTDDGYEYLGQRMADCIKSLAVI